MAARSAHRLDSARKATRAGGLPCTCGAELDGSDGLDRHRVEVAISAARPLILAQYQQETANLQALMRCQEVGHNYVFGDPLHQDGRCERCPALITDDPEVVFE